MLIPPPTIQKASNHAAPREKKSGLAALALIAASLWAPALVFGQASLTVDQNGGGRFSTIASALQAAPPGSTILIRPGTYPESLNIARDMYLQGAGSSPNDVVIENTNGSPLYFQTDRGGINNLTLRYDGNGNKAALLISRGQPVIDNVDMTSSGNTYVLAVGGGANPTIRNSRIYGGSGGVLIETNGKGHSGEQRHLPEREDRGSDHVTRRPGDHQQPDSP